MKTKNSFGYAVFGGLGLLLALQGCGDDDDKNPKPPVIGDGGSDNTGNTGSGAKAGTGGKANGGSQNDGGSDNTGNAGATGAAGGEGGAPAFVPECNLPERGEDGCFNCPDNGETEQFLNRCLDTDCEPFDNDRLPQLEDDGSLPALP